MLYDRWKQVLASHRGRVALADLRSGVRYTFEQLDSAAAAGETTGSFLTYSHEHGGEFVIGVLRSWRGGAAVCAVESSQQPPALDRLPAGCAHLKLTSASTGPAKAVAFTAAQLAADADNILSTMGLRPEWPNIGAISLAHSYGFSNLVLPLLLHGIPLFLTSPFPEAIRSALGMGPATLAGVPALWRTWHEAGALSPNIRLAISAGAPLGIDLERSIFSNSGLKVHNFYGATECGGIAYDNSAAPRRDDAFVGKPLHNVGLDRSPDGCLVVQSEAVGLTYWPVPDPSLGNGRFKTNDLVDLDDGGVSLRGRLGDQINVAGRKVSPELIERALRQDVRVGDCVVFGVPNGESGRGDIIVACVATKEKLSGEHLRLVLVDRLAPWQIPREWFFVEADTLPVNERGKLSRAEWRQRYLATVAWPSRHSG